MSVFADGAVEGAVVGGGTALLVAVLAAAVGGMVALIHRGAVEVDDGVLVMTYGVGYQVVAGLVLLFGLALLGLTAAGLLRWVDVGDVLAIPAVMGAMFSLGGGLAVVDAARRWVRVSDAGVAGQGPLGRTGLVRWADVERVRWSNLGAFVVEGAGRAVMVPTTLGGREAFMAACRRNLRKRAYRDVFEKHGNNPLGV